MTSRMTTVADRLFEPQKWRYIARAIRSVIDGKYRQCPACGGTAYQAVGRHYAVTSLVRCLSCKLLYRIPIDPPDLGTTFYQTEYQAGFATDCPSPERLQALLQTEFVASSMDFSHKLDVLRALGLRPPARLLDFGASWGYGTWQFLRAGYDVVGYEISRPRARYARERVSVPVLADLSAVGEGFDVFFSSHVLEHLPSPKLAFDEARRRLSKGGVFVAFTPNGSEAALKRNVSEYHRYWGRIHGTYLDDVYYRTALTGLPMLICSTDNDSPYDLDWIASWQKTGEFIGDLSKGELCVAVVF